ADRFDPRRIIQIGMVLFMGASVAWGVLFWTDTLEMWHAIVILSVHGLAGVFWGPAGQMLVHDIVGPKQLHSAVRLLATSRTLGLLLGPAVGGAAMIILGPAVAVFLNVAIYLPLTIWLWKAPFGAKFRAPENGAKSGASIRGFSDIIDAFREAAKNRTLISLTLLAGLGSLFVGNAYQAQMPEFATFLNEGAGLVGTSVRYNILFAATAAGALFAGIALEAKNLLQPSLRSAFILAVLWCAAVIGFAAASNFVIAVMLLFAVGFTHLSFNAMAQAMVQLSAPAAMRGRILGLYNMSALGLMTFSGVTIGFGGSLVGVHWSLGLSAATLLAVILVLAFVIGRGTRAAAG
ncbi:MAG: MFS transporter, partial [Rhodospirillaceae bacterium]|nr:MFS transporter [Rhodospirillaceae bacterium]